jgi:hypothetical protein
VTREQNARRHPRSKVQKQVLVAWMKGTQKHVSRVENLALGGLFVCTQDSPAVGTVCSCSSTRRKARYEYAPSSEIWSQDEVWASPSFRWSRNTGPVWTDG